VTTISKRPRDPRLDFFRGLGMFIIFIAHVPGNSWTLWIPARFGFSDATEIFVFCSGMASAIAFGRVFNEHSWSMGTARIVYRIWQVYWSHIAVFLTIAAMLVTIDHLGSFDGLYVRKLNLQHFFDRPAENLVGYLTLTYVPNLFDILPMYLGILALVPVVMGLGMRHPAFAGILIAGLWLAANFHLLDLPAEPWSDRTWFFNPFAWQLVFFTGFAFGLKWLPAPPVNRWLIILAILFVVLTIPVAWYKAYNAVPLFAEWRGEIAVLINKTRFGFFRYVHFLSLAYLAWVVAGEGGKRLQGGVVWTRFVLIVQKVGQQSLAVFLVSLVAARFSGFVLDQMGRNFGSAALVNLAGFALLIGIAYSVSWFKRQPWRFGPTAT
jgi:hypothetical protein